MLSTPVTVDSIDEAWNEAEAALPEGWIVWGVRAVVRNHGVSTTIVIAGYRARAVSWNPLVEVVGDGPTRVLAFRDLTAKLRDYR